MKKRILATAVVAGILAFLVYLQYRSWREFDWDAFARQTRTLNWWWIAAAIGLIYLAYVLRAVRWKVFLRPVCNASFTRLVAPQFIGFTGLALLGRPGEFVRPYLIAKKENLSVASQIAVWTVERIFDMGAFTFLMVVDIFFFGHDLPFPGQLRKAGFVLVGIVGALAVLMYLTRVNAEGVSGWFSRRLQPISHRVADSVAAKIRSFGEGLNTIEGWSSFAQLAAVSICMWLIIAASYRCVMLAYTGTVLSALDIPHVILLMGSSMVGSLLQLPAVGGGSQLATISMMAYGFAPARFADPSRGVVVPIELATSAGILLWIVSFLAVIPVGLLLARSEQLSLRRLSHEAHQPKPSHDRALV